jgi:hypothetical protein
MLPAGVAHTHSRLLLQVTTHEILQLLRQTGLAKEYAHSCTSHLLALVAAGYFHVFDEHLLAGKRKR